MLKLGALFLLVAAASAVSYYDRPFEVRQRMMGTFMDGNSFTQDAEVKEHSETEAAEFMGSAPSSFDAKMKWPACRSIIGFIKNQAACGSCWAVSASEVIADRECISCGDGRNVTASSQGVAVLPNNEPVPAQDVSAEQIMSCCNYCGNGCQGGYPIDAMRYWCETGVVSGGWYHSQCGCQSYKVDPANHNELPTPACTVPNCDNPNYPVPFAQDKRYCKRYYSVKGESAMMQEIMTNGPIQCAFTVYQSFEDFFRSPSNAQKVYKKPNKWFDRRLGGHAIKIVGWGVASDGTKYWLINNSWDTNWADHGIFRFQRGIDLDGMESQCVAGTPKCGMNRPMKSHTLQCKGRDF